MLPHSSEGATTPPARGWRTWFDAWLEAAYGAEGFWRLHSPDAHFRTAAASGPMIAQMLAALIDRQQGISSVIDVGAGNGRLLEQLSAIRPDLRLLGIDMRTRPKRLPKRVDWAQDLWDVRYSCWTSGEAAAALARPEPVMIICCEWLDDLPCPVVMKFADGWREVVINDDGGEQAGPRLDDERLAWADRWWPSGERAEIGLTRDQAWAELVKLIMKRGGCVLMIDYAHTAERRPVTGSLAAYRDGRALEPAAGAGVNLTAHVAVDAVRAAGEALGATTTFCGLQSEVAPDLLQTDAHPDPLVDLGRRSLHATLSSQYVWGSHWWLLQC
jgi:SAM-dependent MidA family methyltransferase